MSLDYPNRADWLAKRSTWRNRHKYERLIRPMPSTGKTKDPARTHAQRRWKRMQPSTGPGSINAEDEMRGLVMDGRFTEAAAYYERCFRIHYKSGKPQMRWGTEWYQRWKASRAVA
jgi:hypothetical protein